MNLLKKIYIEHNKVLIRGSDIHKTHKTIHLSFITPPRLIEKLIGRNLHPNQYELNIFIDTLQNLCKNLVVTDYRYKGPMICADITIGFGVGFNASSTSRKYSVYYATGSSSHFQYSSAENEIEYLKSAFEIPLKKYFRFPEYIATSNERSANRIYLIGNQATSRTFDVHSERISLLPGIALNNSKFDAFSSNTRIFRDKILWMGSKGFLHKGLHIAAEVAKNLNLTLIIVGIQSDERDHVNTVLKSVGCDYICYPWIDIMSDDWVSIASSVSFCIGCSVSEGMSTSVLTCCSAGIIPISTDTCGVDEGIIVPFLPRDSLVTRLANALSELIEKTDLELIELRRKIIKSTKENNSKTSFMRTLAKNFEFDLIK